MGDANTRLGSGVSALGRSDSVGMANERTKGRDGMTLIRRVKRTKTEQAAHLKERYADQCEQFPLMRRDITGAQYLAANMPYRYYWILAGGHNAK